MENIEQHFRPEEKAFIHQVMSWMEQVEEQYRPILTPFLNPREVFIATTLAQRQQCIFETYSHFNDAERTRMLFYPDYYEVTTDDFETIVLEINYAHKFNQLKHSQILGALLHQGIQREMLGDIVTDGVRFQVETTTALASYLINQVNAVGKVPVQLTEVDDSQVLEKQNDAHYENTTITSFRLDNIVATVYNISRKRAKELIQKSQVQVNYHIVEQPDFQLSVNDFVSVRRFGRCKITMVDDQKTKKDKFRITYSVIRK